MGNTLTILSTRELDNGLVQEFNEMANGLDSFILKQVAFIEMIPRKDETLTATINQLANENILAVFTSRISVGSVVNMLETKPAAWQAACMGGATRNAAADLLGESSVVLTSSSAKDLGEQLLAAAKEKHVVFFAGNRRLNDLPDLLHDNEYNFTELIVYDTHETPVLIEDRYDAILFFSPSAALSFFSMNTVSPATVLFSIGETTAGVLRTLSPNKVIVSAVHSPRQLFKTVIGYFTSDPNEQI